MKTQKASGVERENPPDRDEQAFVTVERPKGSRQVAPDLEEDLERVRPLRSR
jgi:hypothetical protein